MNDKAIPQGQNGHLDHSQEEWLRLMPDGWDGTDYVAENTKLRELLTDYYNAPCMICNPWAGEYRCKYDEDENCLLATRAVELGIEVTGK